MWLTVFLLLAIVALIYIFLTWNFSYWKNLGIIGPKPKILTGNFPSLFNQKQHMVYDIDDIYREYKDRDDFVGIFSIRNPQIMILDPQLCRRVLSTDFRHFHDNEFSTMINEKTDYIFGNNLFLLTGEKWKERRNMLTPGITQNRIKAAYPVTIKVCKMMTAYMKQQLKAPSKDGMEAKNLCLRFTTQMVSDCVLGLSANSFEEKPTPIMQMIDKLFNTSTSAIIYMTLVGFWPALKKLYKTRAIPKICEDFFVDLVSKAIDLRKTQIEKRNDFLNYMLELQTKKNFSVYEITPNIMTFLLDGFETTSTAIAHCLLLLARNPDKQNNLREEILEHVNAESVIDFDKLLELPYLDACVHESIRIMPPGFFSTKLCTEPTEMTNRNGVTYKLRRGDVVLLPLYSIMIDEDYFPEAQKFVPERFLKENCSVKDYRERGLFLGFGDGPRICFGMKFALAQIKAALVEVLRNFNVTVNDKTHKHVRYDPKYFLGRVEGGVWLDFEERQ